MPAPYCYDHPRASVTVDVAVFAMRDRRLDVLLIRRRHDPFAGRWALPGGFLEMDEPLEVGARRELREETGLVIDGPIEPVGFFGDLGRDPRGRTISLAYAGVIHNRADDVIGGDDAAEARWLHANQPIDLAFDHHRILVSALSWLREGTVRGDLGLKLLAPQFSTVDAQAMFREMGLPVRSTRAWIARMIKSQQLVPLSDPRPLYNVIASS